MVCTALVPVLGYDKTSLIAKEARATGETIRECTLRLGLLTEEELDVLLDYKAMTEIN
jgi:aspartate ammonia-lyase